MAPHDGIRTRQAPQRFVNQRILVENRLDVSKKLTRATIRESTFTETRASVAERIHKNALSHETSPSEAQLKIRDNEAAAIP